MTYDEFKSLLDTITTYYGLEKSISPERIRMWHRRVEHIPFQAARQIKNRIFEDHDYLPRNIPKAFNKAYHAFATSNTGPDFKQEPCDDCRGSGLFFPFLMDNRAKRYEKRVIACGNCDNWKRHFGGLDMWVGAGKDVSMRVERKTKAEIMALPFFAGFDGAPDTIDNIRRLNEKMRIANNQRVNQNDGG